MNKPFFSVILPTYNRANFLPLAIQSVLQQSFEDFELVISNGGSTDNTRNVVAEFKDKRIRYIETDKRLSMSENYQHALNHSSGEFIIFFSDDDAFIPTSLMRARRILNEKNTEMVVFAIAYYFHETTTEFSYTMEKNSLAFFPYSSKVVKVESRHAIEQMFQQLNLIDVPRDHQYVNPFIGNIVCHRSIFERLKSQKHQLFATIPIDTYFITIVLGNIDIYYHLSEPLLVWSRWSRNATASLNMKGDSLRQHYEKQLNGESLRYVPLKYPLQLNCGANAALHAKNDLGKTLGYLNIDWSKYFIKQYEYLSYLQEVGVNTKREFEEFNQTVAKQPPELQKSIESQLSLTNSLLKTKIKKFIRKNAPSVAQTLIQIFKLNSSEKIKIVKGNEINFRNFLECAEYLDNNLEQFSSKGK